MNGAELSRRGFLKAGAVAGGGLLVSFTLPLPGAASDSTLAPNAFLRVSSSSSSYTIIDSY